MTRSFFRYCAFLLLLCGLNAPDCAFGQATETVLHSFAGATTDGADSTANLVLGPDGNFYGTTRQGGFSIANDGVVFRINPSGALTIKHFFGLVTNDGINPYAGLILATDGYLYGTTRGGGSTGIYGSVFKINPTGTLTILHNFHDGTVSNDGSSPQASLVQGSDGNFYGTTQSGGSANSDGIIFKMTPSGSLTVLHIFDSIPQDGIRTSAPLIQGTDENFYGTTPVNGSSNGGTVFKITASGSYTILHSFLDGSVTNDGADPEAGLIQGSDGDFYGTTSSGAAGSSSINGTAFKITPSGSVTILHRFSDGSVTNDGKHPHAPLMQASDGNFYGTTLSGGSSGNGTIFQITPTGTETVLHHFNDGSVANDTGAPEAGLLQGPDGYLYGTASGDSLDNRGTVFKLAVPSVINAVNGNDTPVMPPWALAGLGLLLLLAAARYLPRKSTTT